MKQINLKISLLVAVSSLVVATGCSNSTEGSRLTEPAVITSSDASLETESASPTATVTVTPSASSDASSSPSSSASSSSNASDDEIILSTATTSLGEIIVGKDGMAVYYFTNDVQGSETSNCKGQCLVNWPPVISESGNPKVEGITAEVDTIKFGEEQKHVTVNGMPVYYWIKDQAPGDVTGQGVQNVWYVIAPDGTMIETPLPGESAAVPNAAGAGFSLAPMSVPAKKGSDDVVPEAPHMEGADDGTADQGRQRGSDDAPEPVELPEPVEPPHIDVNDVPEVTDVAPVMPAPVVPAPAVPAPVDVVMEAPVVVTPDAARLARIEAELAEEQSRIAAERAEAEVKAAEEIAKAEASNKAEAEIAEERADIAADLAGDNADLTEENGREVEDAARETEKVLGRLVDPVDDDAEVEDEAENEVEVEDEAEVEVEVEDEAEAEIEVEDEAEVENEVEVEDEGVEEEDAA